MSRLKGLRFLLLVFLMFLFIISGCTKKPEGLGELQNLTFEFDGIQREYLLYVPESYEKNTNLVIALHGIMNTNFNFVDTSKLNDVADQYGFVVCYPQALPGFKTKSEWADYDGWNSNLSYSTVDDDGFLDALSDELIAKLELDDHVYCFGYSAGATMCYHMALYNPDKYVGIASFSGRMSGQDWDLKSTAGKTKVFQVCGSKEVLALNPEANEPYDPNYVSKSPVPTLEEIIEFWAETNGSSTSKCTTLKDGTLYYEFFDENDDRRVVYYLINQMGHSWPSKGVFNDILPSEAAWLFLKEN